jgi:hypothetical protein
MQAQIDERNKKMSHQDFLIQDLTKNVKDLEE